MLNILALSFTAEGRGCLKSAKRSKRDEQVTLTLAYDDGPDTTLDLDRAYEVFQNRYYCGDTASSRRGKTPLIQEELGYYTRFCKILARFKALAGEPLASADLTLGEDVCQADMVACASPGWGRGLQMRPGKAS